MRTLDLGCGTSKRTGAIGADGNIAVRPDVVCDLDRPPYPFREDSFDEIYLDNVLEHLDDVVACVEEIARIARKGAAVTISVPYFRSRYAAVDPTHRHQFTVDSFGYFDPSHPFRSRYRYTTAALAVERITFNEGWMAGRRPGGVAATMLARLASRWPRAYESLLSHVMPLAEITFHLRVVYPPQR